LLAFQHREKLLASAAQRIKKLIDSGLDPYDAFNIVHQMIDVAQAYLERVVLSSFKRPYRTLKTKTKIMLKLYQLYALSQIEKIKDGISRMVIWKL
jgi:acyl-CoA oxidase